LQRNSGFGLQISDEQVIHSHTPLLTLPYLRRRHCLIVGQGPVVEIAQQEYPFNYAVFEKVGLKSSEIIVV